MLLLDWIGVVEKAHRDAVVPAYAAADASHHLVARTNGDNDEPARADIVCEAKRKCVVFDAEGAPWIAPILWRSNHLGAWVKRG